LSVISLLKHKGEFQYLSTGFCDTWYFFCAAARKFVLPPGKKRKSLQKEGFYGIFCIIMPGLTIKAPGKINLHLRVKERHSDGYHGLESIFLALDFGDLLRFSLLDRAGAAEIRGLESLPREENAVFRALTLFRAETGFDRGLRVDLEKRIPLGGGMGGGSSDAAFTLLALNEISGAALSASRLEAMAGKLGSDTPFFLTGGAAWVSGRGELIEPLPLPADLPVVLVNPGFPSGTAEAFRLLDALREGAAPTRGDPPPARELLVKALEGPPRDWPFFNDFLPVLSAGPGRIYPGLLDRLKTLGADFAGLSGAGSTCFGVFTEAEKAEKAAETLRRDWPFVQVTFPLARSAQGVLK
jgi:4-diphosphocytidyl-2-C-methyl-D-erythritol kinase